MSKSLTKNSEGFTIIESIVAITILAIGLFSVVLFFPFSTKIIGNSQDSTTATSLALAKIEEISATSYDNLTVGTYEIRQAISSDPDSYLNNFERQTIIATIDENFSSSVSDEGLKKITVTVYWQSSIGGTERLINIDTVRADF